MIAINGRRIGPGEPCFVIAEAGVNHNGDPALAKQLVDIAVAAGADAVKFQTFKSDLVVSPLAEKASYQVATTGSAESQLEMVKRLELSEAAFAELRAYCDDREIMFLSTAFDECSLEFVAGLDVAAFKIPSGELTNLPLLRQAASYGRPLIVSTGMANLGEIEGAIETLRAAGATEIALLHCVSAYPTAPEHVNLRAIQTLVDAFALPTGYSDHTLGVDIALAAVALGSCIIEKHFTVDRGMSGPDHQASLSPDELKDLVSGIRRIEAAFGSGRKEPAACELDTARVARRSVVALVDVAEGTVLSRGMLGLRRPGTGAPPSDFERFVGRTVTRDVVAGTPLDWESVR
jgi:N,N'-diacetyllegionaminate synthase